MLKIDEENGLLWIRASGQLERSDYDDFVPRFEQLVGRKPGKLPMATIGIDYALEYGTDRLEMDPGAIEPGQKVVIVDDLIATGGTALASAELLRKAGAVIEHALFVIDLPDLGGAARMRAAGITVSALMQFEGD